MKERQFALRLATCFHSPQLFYFVFKYFGIIFTRYFKEFQSASMAKTYDTMVIPCFGHGITMVIYYFFFFLLVKCASQ